MNLPQITLSPELPEHDAAVEELSAIAFGPGRFTRTAFRLREGVPSRPDLSFVAHLNGRLIGSVKLTDILVGSRRSLLLGPLVVIPEFKNAGYGRALMEHVVNAARKLGEESIILVGDAPYYGRFGFEKVPHGSMRMPGPVDPQRLLVCYLQENPQELSGDIRSI